MITTQTLQMLIDKNKLLPNSLERNKLMSHLQSAMLIAKLMEYQTQERYGDGPVIDDVLNTQSGCICPDGTEDATCPIHGVRR